MNTYVHHINVNYVSGKRVLYFRVSTNLNIYIRPLSFVQNKLRFILHEPYDLS